MDGSQRGTGLPVRWMDTGVWSAAIQPSQASTANRRMLEMVQFPLGVKRDRTFEQCSSSLQRGETMVLYSDGVIELTNPQGSQFTYERLSQCVAFSAEPTNLLSHIREVTTEFSQGLSPGDDVSLLILHRIAQ